MKHPTPARFGAAALAGALAACLLAAALTAALLGLWHSRRQMALLDGFCTALVAGAPDTAEAVYRLARQRRYPVRLTVPAETGLPASLSAGTLSPVRADSSDFKLKLSRMRQSAGT